METGFQLNEEYGDLFSVESKYWLAHCISSDLALGAGIAAQFADFFDEREILRRKYGDAGTEYFDSFGYDVYIDEDNRVYNLVTKRFCYEKPTYESLTGALELMRDDIKKKGIHYLAIPQIGCGIDGLQWDKVKAIIFKVFRDTDIEILVKIWRK